MVEYFDFIVLGGGKGGKTIAIELGKAGKKTALVEIGMIGGSCINVACIPTKTMVHSAKINELIHHSSMFGTEVKKQHIDLKLVNDRKNSVIKEMREATRELFLHTENLEFILGKGRFVENKTLEVETQEGKRTLTAKFIIINTGSRPKIPNIQGLQDIPFLTSSSLLELTNLPSHLIILGGGYIGLEFAQMFRRFGSQVTLLHSHSTLINREDKDVSDEISKILHDEGVKINLDSQIVSIKKINGNAFEIEILKNNEKKETLEGSHLLLAIGREPNTSDLNLEATSVAINEKGFIKVNDKLQTTNPDIWALGDVNGGPQFTHVSYDDFRIVQSQIMGDGSRTSQNRLIPYTLFIDPQLARVGMSEKEARDKGFTIRIAKLAVSSIPRAKTTGEKNGFLKVIIDAKTDQILGCALLCAEAGEMLGALQIAMIGKIPYQKLRDTIFAHPTLIEGFNMLFSESSMSG